MSSSHVRHFGSSEVSVRRAVGLLKHARTSYWLGLAWRYDDHHEWIEMFLRSKRAQVIHIGDLDLDVSFDGGEMMRTEISAKFRRPRIEAELAVAGLRVVRWWTDGRRDFSVSLSTQSDASHRPELRKR